MNCVAEQLALTFDDGPWPGGTDKILKLLDEHNVRATFFVCGEQVNTHPNLVRDAVAAGHSVQPHCWSHATSYHDLSTDLIRDDIDRLLALLDELGVATPSLWRPPWGAWRPGANDVLAQERGLRLTGWTIDSSDWSGVAATKMYDHVRMKLEQTFPSPTPALLMHDCPLERGQWAKRRTVDETIQLVRHLVADRVLELGPQLDAVPDCLDPPLG